MKTAHSFARELLNGPDLPVAVPKFIEYNDNPEDSCAEPIVSIVDGSALDEPSKIVLITYTSDAD